MMLSKALHLGNSGDRWGVTRLSGLVIPVGLANWRYVGEGGLCSLRNRIFPFNVLPLFSMPKILFHNRRKFRIIHGSDIFFPSLAGWPSKGVGGKDSDPNFSPFSQLSQVSDLPVVCFA